MPTITCSKCRENKEGADPVRWLCVDCADHPVHVTRADVNAAFERAISRGIEMRPNGFVLWGEKTISPELAKKLHGDK